MTTLDNYNRFRCQKIKSDVTEVHSMYASFIVVKFKPGTRDDVIQTMRDIEGDMKAIPGFVRLMSLDFGDDSGASIVTYESKEAWEAAAPKSQELMSGFGAYFAEMPERKGCEITVAY